MSPMRWRSPSSDSRLSINSSATFLRHQYWNGSAPSSPTESTASSSVGSYVETTTPHIPFSANTVRHGCLACRLRRELRLRQGLEVLSYPRAYSASTLHAINAAKASNKQPIWRPTGPVRSRPTLPLSQTPLPPEPPQPLKQPYPFLHSRRPSSTLQYHQRRGSRDSRRSSVTDGAEGDVSASPSFSSSSSSISTANGWDHENPGLDWHHHRHDHHHHHWHHTCGEEDLNDEEIAALLEHEQHLRHHQQQHAYHQRSEKPQTNGSAKGKEPMHGSPPARYLPSPRSDNGGESTAYRINGSTAHDANPKRWSFPLTKSRIPVRSASPALSSSPALSAASSPSSENGLTPPITPPSTSPNKDAVVGLGISRIPRLVGRMRRGSISSTSAQTGGRHGWVAQDETSVFADDWDDIPSGNWAYEEIPEELASDVDSVEPLERMKLLDAESSQNGTHDESTHAMPCGDALEVSSGYNQRQVEHIEDAETSPEQSSQEVKTSEESVVEERSAKSDEAQPVPQVALSEDGDSPTEVDPEVEREHERLLQLEREGKECTERDVLVLSYIERQRLRRYSDESRSGSDDEARDAAGNVERDVDAWSQQSNEEDEADRRKRPHKEEQEMKRTNDTNVSACVDAILRHVNVSIQNVEEATKLETRCQQQQREQQQQSEVERLLSQQNEEQKKLEREGRDELLSELMDSIQHGVNSSIQQNAEAGELEPDISNQEEQEENALRLAQENAYRETRDVCVFEAIDALTCCVDAGIQGIEEAKESQRREETRQVEGRRQQQTDIVVSGCIGLVQRQVADRIQQVEEAREMERRRRDQEERDGLVSRLMESIRRNADAAIQQIEEEREAERRRRKEEEEEEAALWAQKHQREGRDAVVSQIIGLIQRNADEPIQQVEETKEMERKRQEEAEAARFAQWAAECERESRDAVISLVLESIQQKVEATIQEAAETREAERRKMQEEEAARLAQWAVGHEREACDAVVSELISLMVLNVESAVQHIEETREVERRKDKEEEAARSAQWAAEREREGRDTVISELVDLVQRNADAAIQEAEESTEITRRLKEEESAEQEREGRESLVFEVITLVQQNTDAAIQQIESTKEAERRKKKEEEAEYFAQWGAECELKGREALVSELIDSIKRNVETAIGNMEEYKEIERRRTEKENAARFAHWAAEREQQGRDAVVSERIDSALWSVDEAIQQSEERKERERKEEEEEEEAARRYAQQAAEQEWDVRDAVDLVQQNVDAATERVEETRDMERMLVEEEQARFERRAPECEREGRDAIVSKLINSVRQSLDTAIEHVEETEEAERRRKEEEDVARFAQWSAEREQEGRDVVISQVLESIQQDVDSHINELEGSHEIKRRIREEEAVAVMRLAEGIKSRDALVPETIDATKSLPDAKIQTTEEAKPAERSQKREGVSVTEAVHSQVDAHSEPEELAQAFEYSNEMQADRGPDRDLDVPTKQESLTTLDVENEDEGGLRPSTVSTSASTIVVVTQNDNDEDAMSDSASSVGTAFDEDEDDQRRTQTEATKPVEDGGKASTTNTDIEAQRKFAADVAAAIGLKVGGREASSANAVATACLSAPVSSRSSVIDVVSSGFNSARTSVISNTTMVDYGESHGEPLESLQNEIAVDAGDKVGAKEEEEESAAATHDIVAAQLTSVIDKGGGRFFPVVGKGRLGLKMLTINALSASFNHLSQQRQSAGAGVVGVRRPSTAFRLDRCRP
ncbi:hypothetical protein HK102_011052 [Quaeritorhiza haematococci]|nr:hypothetical protein HK102_011052 [Quaeritorhiza haematococci]